MEIIYSSLHHINIEEDSVVNVSLKESEHIVIYINKLFETISKSPNKKICKIRSENTEVIASNQKDYNRQQKRTFM